MRRRKLNKSPVLGFCGFVIGYECKEKGIKLMECDKARNANRVWNPTAHQD